MTLTQKNPGKERIRGPNLAVFIRSDRGVPMEEALRRVDEAGLVMASNKRLGRALFGNYEWHAISDALPCWSGTMVAYDKPDKALGKVIRFTDPNTSMNYEFMVPREHWGKKNVALVAEHPEFTIITEGLDRLVVADGVDAIERFPLSREGWFFDDEKHGIPLESRPAHPDGPSARHMTRNETGVCLVARGNERGYHPRHVDLSGWPSIGFGVAVQAANMTLPGDIEPLIREIREPSEGGQLSVRKENGTLIIYGGRGQIEAVARLLEQLKVK
ncbi:MAG: hypothetical protein U0R44_05730 [Candidatus Micrarchaeia archaeon]